MPAHQRKPSKGLPAKDEARTSPASKTTSGSRWASVSWRLLTCLGLVCAAAAVYFRRRQGIWHARGDSSLWTLVHQGSIKEDTQKKEAIVDAFKHSWNAYKRDAFGFDNYHPISHKGSNIAKSPVGYFVVDCLDSLLLFGLRDDYKMARDWVLSELTFDVDDRHHAFEITIRVLGGLLAACHLTEGNDAELLAKAIDLGQRLLPIFRTRSGIPYSFINLQRRVAIPDRENYNLASVAEAGTLQMEFRYLSELSGDRRFWDQALKASTVISRGRKFHGLAPLFISCVIYRPTTGDFQFSDIRLGSRGDSYYEYLGKLYQQSNGTDQKWQKFYDEAVTGIQKALLARGRFHNSLYTVELLARESRPGQKTSFSPVRKQDHLACFLPGLLLLCAADHGKRLDFGQMSEKQLVEVYMAVELLDTCVDTYTRTATGLAPEIVFFYGPKTPKTSKTKADWYIDKRLPKKPYGRKPPPPYDARNMLRPETLESLFVAYRMTGNPKYRQQAWDIFQAFEKHCKIASGGYATILDVDDVPVTHEDRMETFWLSESLKYLYLIFSDENVVPLSRNVLTTEAHIFPIFEPKVTK